MIMCLCLRVHMYTSLGVPSWPDRMWELWELKVQATVSRLRWVLRLTEVQSSIALPVAQL